MPPRSESERKERLLIDLLRLRRIDKLLSFNEDVRELRLDLEEQLGESVSQRLAAKMLGVSQAALSKLVNSAKLPLVDNSAGRAQVSVTALLDLMEQADELREEVSEDDRRRPLDSIMLDRKRDVERSPDRPRADKSVAQAGSDPKADRERIADMRALAHHRAIARKLERSDVEAARERLEDLHAEGMIDEVSYGEWRTALKKPLGDVRARITEDSQAGRDLRRTSPFD